SDLPDVGTIQATVGRLPAAQSASNFPGWEIVSPRSYSPEPGSAFWKFWKYRSTLVPEPSSSGSPCQLIPASSSRSGYVPQLYGGVGTTLVMIGPPAVPFGSFQPVIRNIRLGQVGPSSEQW